MRVTQALSNQTFARNLPPGPKGLPVVGVAPLVLKNPLTRYGIQMRLNQR